MFVIMDFFIRRFYFRFNLLRETMYHFTQKFWKGWSKNWEGLSPLAP